MQKAQACSSVSYLCRLGHCLIQHCGTTFHLLLDGQVAPLGVHVALPHRRPLLETEFCQLGPDLQQLVDVRLVLGDGLPEQLDGEVGRGKR